MTAIGSTIRQLREERDWTPARLSAEIGLSDNELLQRESGSVSVQPHERFAFAKAFGLSIIEFDERWRQCAAPQRPGAPGIPLLNRDSNGDVTDYEQPGVELGMDCAYTDFGDIDDASAFGVIVVGDSMKPALHKGDCLILSPLDSRQADEKLEPKTIVFVRFSDQCGGGCVLARYKESSEDDIRLERDNPSYAPIACRREDISAMAVAIEQREQPQH